MKLISKNIRKINEKKYKKIRLFYLSLRPIMIKFKIEEGGYLHD